MTAFHSYFQRLGSAAVEDTCPEGMHVEEAEVEEAAAVDNCPERMHAADAESPAPPRIATAVEF